MDTARERVTFLSRGGQVSAGRQRSGAVSFRNILLRCPSCSGRERLLPEVRFCITLGFTTVRSGFICNYGI